MDVGSSANTHSNAPGVFRFTTTEIFFENFHATYIDLRNAYRRFPPRYRSITRAPDSITDW
jgi:hypothetical protein